MCVAPTTIGGSGAVTVDKQKLYHPVVVCFHPLRLAAARTCLFGPSTPSSSGALLLCSAARGCCTVPSLPAPSRTTRSCSALPRWITPPSTGAASRSTLAAAAPDVVGICATHGPAHVGTNSCCGPHGLAAVGPHGEGASALRRQRPSVHRIIPSLRCTSCAASPR